MDANQWEKLLTEAGLEAPSAASYSKSFAKQKLSRDHLPSMDQSMLEELGVNTMGDRLSILKLGKKSQPKETETLDKSKKLSCKIPVKTPTLHADMTSQQFRKFLVDWTVFCQITDLPDDRVHAQLYSCADDSVQSALVSTYPDFFDIPVKSLLDKVETVVTQRANPMVHRMTFGNIYQKDQESIQNFVIRLRSAAEDCDFNCPECKKNISNTYIKDQFIRGLNNEMLQTDILAKAESLKSITETVKHAEAFEAALRDQGKIADTVEVSAVRISQYRKKKTRPIPAQENTSYNKQTDIRSISNRNDSDRSFANKPPCVGCGSKHTRPGFREHVCPAWGKRCAICRGMNHFAKVCKSANAHFVSEDDNGSQANAFHLQQLVSEENPAKVLHVEDLVSDSDADALVAHIQFEEDNSFTDCVDPKEIEEIKIKISPFVPHPDPREPNNIPPDTLHTFMKVFPDSGASICLCGPKHLKLLGLSNNHLIKCNKIAKCVGNYRITCHGWLPVEFELCGKTSKQALYVCDKVERVYLSKRGCKALGILPSSFPNPTPDISPPTLDFNQQSSAPDNTKVYAIPTHSEQSNPIPTRPRVLPFPPTEENVGKLKQWLLDQFSSTAFSNEGKFPSLSGPPAHIHMKEGAVPKARHSPIPVPFHMKKAVKDSIDDDVRRGILIPVPMDTPTQWCSTMVITPKKNGKPRRTIDYQYLNSQCLRETHHTSSPFSLAMQVPPNSRKTVLDAVDGYHSVALDEESQPLTTFITEWGRYMYRRMPQGYLASGDAYTRRYDEIISEVPRKVKIVDDTLLWDFSIEESFFHTFDFLVLGYKNGVRFNRSKFEFCSCEVQFGGLQLTKTGISPSSSMLAAILDFPVPQNLTDARSWFGLVNQVAWAYSLGQWMQPFRDLVKSKTQFTWTQTLQDAFDRSKKVIVDMVREGVSTFDPGRTTCLAPDWSKNGMGFLLLQKYCPCPMTKAPICCPDGWKLVFAGSRFCNDAETRYAPIEGEAAAIAWALQKCRMFVMGCHNLLVVTDHAPLLGILGDRDLSKIVNPRLFKIKQKTLLYRYNIQHCPGRWHRGSDAMSRNIPSAMKTIFEVCILRPNMEEKEMTQDIEAFVKAVSMEAIVNYGDDTGAISPDMVRVAGHGDETIIHLANCIEKGFPKSRSLLDPTIRSFWEVRDRLSTDNGLVLLDCRIVIPRSLRKRVLQCLHSAHQGVVGMKARANETIYWPGLDADIRNFRSNCTICNTIAPSQPKEPLVLTPTPDWPFQSIVMDLFEVGHHMYIACADRFTGWLILYHLGTQQDSRKVISICRDLFQNYGVPEEFSSDGGPQFMSSTFLDFLKTWGVKHRLSSVAYAQSNGRAELAVKAAKRIVFGNTTANGSLDNDKAARAVLQYRNTPIQGIGLSPAQMLLHRNLRDELPARPQYYKPHPEWVIAASHREKSLYKRDAKLIEGYNRHAHTLPNLSIGDEVTLQNKNRRWDRTGKIIEVLDNRQYRIRVDGSGRVTVRNRRFIRRINVPVKTLPIPSAGTPVMVSNSSLSPNASPFTPPNTSASIPHNPSANTVIHSNRPGTSPKKIPKALLRILPYNNAGFRELEPPNRPRTRSGTEGGGEM